MLQRLVYFFRRAWRNMRQSPVLNSVAIGTVAVSLTILTFFALVVLNVQQVTRHWGDKVEILIYLDQPPADATLERWQKQITELPEVAGVYYVSQQEAYERFSSRLGAEAGLLDGVDAKILPASLEVSLRAEFRHRQGVAAVVERLRDNPHFSELQYGQDWLERFESFVALLKVIGAVLGSFLLFAALFIVSNTIKLTLYARRDELEIMSLIGATSMFIKTPFLFEGALQGAMGGLLALGGSYALFHAFLREGLTDLLLASGVETIVFLPLPWQGLVLGAGVLLGVFGSLVSLRKLVKI